MAAGAWRASGAATAVLIGALLVAGTIEVVAAVVQLSDSGPAALATYGAPSAFLPLSIAALVASFAGRRARIAAFFGTGAALIARIVFASLLVVPGWSQPIGSLLTIGAGVVTALGLLGWSLYLVVAHRDLSYVDDKAQPVAPHRAAAPAAASPAQSPSTPLSAPHPNRGQPQPGNWATASTPWPRADEADPDGTLIRPPRR